MGRLGLAALMCPSFLRMSPAVYVPVSAPQKVFLFAKFPQRESALELASAKCRPASPLPLLPIPCLPFLASFPPCHCSAVKLASRKNTGFGVKRLWGQVQLPHLLFVRATLGNSPHLCNLSVFL